MLLWPFRGPPLEGKAGQQAPLAGWAPRTPDPGKSLVLAEFIRSAQAFRAGSSHTSGDICPWGPVEGSFSSLLPCCSVSCEHGLQPYICSSWLLDLKILLNCYENEYINICKPNTLCLLLNLAQSNYQDGSFYCCRSHIITSIPLAELKK